MERSEYVKQWKDKRKASGLCVGCGQPLDRDGSYCTKCRGIINKTTRERRQWYLSHKICPRCGKNDLMGDETICPECRAKGTNNALKNVIGILTILIIMSGRSLHTKKERKLVYVRDAENGKQQKDILLALCAEKKTMPLGEPETEFLTVLSE